MIRLYFDYDYSDIPLGDWTTNCFDSRLCEGDYAEKIIRFFMYMFDSLKFKNKTAITFIYSSNQRFCENEYQIFYNNYDCKKGIETLIEWGKLIDDFLNSKEDYLKLIYLIDSLYYDEKYNEYHISKLFSICQLFLEKSKELELDSKLPLFLNKEHSFESRKKMALYFRLMRNKIAHGDFIKLEKVIDRYSKDFLPEFSFDYSEYSEKNWAVINACCELTDAVKNLIGNMLYNNYQLMRIKATTIVDCPDILNDYA